MILIVQICSFSAEINDLSICYVLKDGDNATNDIFHFSIEDSGEFPGLKRDPDTLIPEDETLNSSRCCSLTNSDFSEKGNDCIHSAMCLIKQNCKSKGVCKDGRDFCYFSLSK